MKRIETVLEICRTISKEPIFMIQKSQRKRRLRLKQEGEKCIFEETMVENLENL